MKEVGGVLPLQGAGFGATHSAVSLHVKQATPTERMARLVTVSRMSL